MKTIITVQFKEEDLIREYGDINTAGVSGVIASALAEGVDGELLETEGDMGNNGYFDVVEYSFEVEGSYSRDYLVDFMPEDIIDWWEFEANLEEMHEV